MMHYFDSDLSKHIMENELSLIETSKNVLIVKAHPILLEKLYEKKCTIEILKTEMNNQSNEFVTTTLDNLENYDFSVLAGKKFQVIVLDDLLENLSTPKNFLKKIQQFLTDDGFFVSSCYNIYNSVNRINFLNGTTLLSNLLVDKKQLFFSSLNNILLTLSESNFSLSTLLRVKKEITLENQNDLNSFILPEELLQSISNDPESKTFFYVFSFSPISKVDYDTRKWLSQFSTNLVTEGLQEIIAKLRHDFEKYIDYLKQSNREQFTSIQYLEQSLQDKDVYLEQSLKDKDEYTEQSLKDKDEYTEQSLKDKEGYVKQALRDNFKYVEQALREKDEYVEQALREKDEYAEQSLREKDEYAEQALKDKDVYLEQALKDKDAQLNSIKNTFAYKAMRKFDKLSGRDKT